MKEDTGLGRGSLQTKSISDISERKEEREKMAKRTSDCDADPKLFWLN